MLAWIVKHDRAIEMRPAFRKAPGTQQRKPHEAMPSPRSRLPSMRTPGSTFWSVLTVSFWRVSASRQLLPILRAAPLD
jgi:hypothetical protein